VGASATSVEGRALRKFIRRMTPRRGRLGYAVTGRALREFIRRMTPRRGRLGYAVTGRALREFIGRMTPRRGRLGYVRRGACVERVHRAHDAEAWAPRLRGYRILGYVVTGFFDDMLP